jgi:hypothetical protein
MTDIEQKALARINDVRREYPNTADYNAAHIALCRAIEQHEALTSALEKFDDLIGYQYQGSREAMSAMAEAAQEGARVLRRGAWKEAGQPGLWTYDAAIAEAKPKPMPDPLVEVLQESDQEFDSEWDYEPQAKAIRAALEARGLEIRSKNDD